MQRSRFRAAYEAFIFRTASITRPDFDTTTNISECQKIAVASNRANFSRIDAPQWTLFALVGTAMAAYGIATAAAIWLVPWGPARPSAVAAIAAKP